MTALPDDSLEFPCSTAQERFWLLDRLEPGNNSYNVAVRWRLDGTVSTGLIERAWLQIIERHEVLRTIFHEVDGKPVQRVLPSIPFALVEIDLSGLPEAERGPEGDRIGLIEARAPFDLTTGPLLRVTLIRFAPGQAWVYVTTHQIVSDGWSIGVMAREMGTLYRALHEGRPAPLEELPIQYADYARWQLEVLATRGTAAETAYWTKQLADVRPFKVLPDHPKPAVPTTNGAIASIVLPRALTDRVHRLCGERGATLFAAAFAGLAAMLTRVSGATEIIVGTQVSDREQVELEGMIGQFVNSLILRLDTAGDPRFGELIDRARDVTAQALEHRHIPIEQLLGLVRVHRDSEHSALLSVNFIFQRTFIQNEDYGEFRLVDVPSLPVGSIYDLNFFMVERFDGWRFSCQYNTDQFERDTVLRLLGYVQKALESAVERPNRRLSELALVDAGERERLLRRLAETLPAGAGDVSAMVAARAAAEPAAVALACGRQTLDWATLDRRATRLARQLLAQGLQPGQRVLVLLPRGLLLPLALLALLRAGLVIVLLDPDDGEGHLQRQAATAAAQAVLVDGSADARLASLAATLAPLRIDLAAGDTGEGSALLHPVSDAADAALRFDQAGCGDPPSGFVLSRRALALRLASLAERPGLAAADVWLAASATGASSALVELLLPWSVGARLVLATAEELRAPAALLQRLRSAGVTAAHLPARCWPALTGSAPPASRGLRLWTSVDNGPHNRLTALLPAAAEVWQLLPCAATGGFASARRIDASEAAAHLGEPLAATTMVVLDDYGQPQLTGAPGQLCIGGAALAGSLIGGDDPLQPRLIVSALHGDGVRLVRSGIAARIGHDGQLELLDDAQQALWLDGERLDPAPVEALLARAGGIADFALGLRAGSPALHGWLVPAEGADPQRVLARLRAWAAEQLPQRLQPVSVEQVAALPRRTDRRLDRAALATLKARAPDTSPATPGATGDAIEQELCALWATMLALPAVQPDDNFFELGGHSLLAARMLARVEQRHGRRLSLAALFRTPTVRELAALLRGGEQRQFDFRQVVKLQAAGQRTPLLGINNTGIYYGLARQLGPEQPFISLQLFDPSVRDRKMPATLQEVAERYVDLIRRVQPQGPYALIGWCVAGSLALEIAHQLQRAGEPVASLYMMDAWVPNYLKRLKGLRALVAAYSLRWAFILDDWRKVGEGRLTVAEFLESRVLYKRIRGWLRGGKGTAAATQTLEAPADYDQWLLHYLQELSARYEPNRFDGRLVLFRSHREPTGLWFDPNAGWTPYASKGVELVMVDGDHFTMFQGPGVAQIAAGIAQDLGLPQAAATTTPTSR